MQESSLKRENTSRQKLNEGCENVDEFLTTGQVADRLGIAEGTLRYWRSRDEGPLSFKMGRRVCYRAADIQEWLLAQSQRTSRGGAF